MIASAGSSRAFASAFGFDPGMIEHAAARASDHDILLTTAQHRFCGAISLGGAAACGVELSVGAEP